MHGLYIVRTPNDELLIDPIDMMRQLGGCMAGCVPDRSASFANTTTTAARERKTVHSRIVHPPALPEPK
jgi:hypothetical protein